MLGLFARIICVFRPGAVDYRDRLCVLETLEVKSQTPTLKDRRAKAQDPRLKTLELKHHPE